jgi:DNA-binding NarL/FixJ family response regulator
MMATTLGIIEDESYYRESLADFFQSLPGFGHVYTAGSVETFFQIIDPTRPPDVVLLDINLPGVSGLVGILQLREQYPEIDIIMLTAHDDPDRVFQAIKSGADAYLTKRVSLAEIKDTILTVRAGGSYMPPALARKFFDFISEQPTARKKAILPKRQGEIVEHLVEGRSYKMIADEMGISIETVRDHIKKIYRRLHVNCKAEVIRLWMEKKI